jgi:hypothetical protein
MEDDRYKTPCAIWYKHLEVPAALKANHNPDCCFSFTIDRNQQFICSEHEHHCMMESYYIFLTTKISNVKNIKKRMFSGT